MPTEEAPWSERKKWWMDLISNGVTTLLIGGGLWLFQESWKEREETLAAKKASADVAAAREDARRTYLLQSVIGDTRALRSRFLSASWNYYEGELDAMIQVYDHGSGSEAKHAAQLAYEGQLNTNLELVMDEARQACSHDAAASERIGQALVAMNIAKKAAFGIYDAFEAEPPAERRIQWEGACEKRSLHDARELEPCISRRFHIAHDKLHQAFHRVDAELTTCVRAIEGEYVGAVEGGAGR